MSGIKRNALSADLQAQIDGMEIGETHYAVTNTSNMRKHLNQDKRIHISRIHSDISTGIVQIASNDIQNNVLYLSPDSHSQAAALTWNANCAKFIGQSAPGLMNMRSRIGHSANFDALLTVSGYGNEFRNLYFMHGRGSATNLHAIEVTGSRNVFKNVHIGGPMHATESATAGYSSLELTGAQECLFENCVIGTETIARSAANTVLRVGSTSSRNIFRNCVFLMMSSAGTPYFVEVLSTATFGWTLFENCKFINFSSSWATPLTIACAIGCSAGQHRLLFDGDCSFVGVSDIMAAADEAEVIILQKSSTTTLVDKLIAVAADHTA